ncbi:MAG TPA: hypothetical protein VL282_15750 [Tepidisphaeraceae bacterium]|jgi:hypothetical protein|nr:hypothetical protein [Tepidisphaeraceae bacterium]
MRFFILFALLLAGCAPYVDAQMQLTQQARRGVSLAQKALADKRRIVEQYHKLQRAQIDAAFDLDVRERNDLSPQWIVEHRKAYGAVLDGLKAQESASKQADDSTTRTLAATDEALKQLLILQSLQQRALRPLIEKP